MTVRFVRWGWQVLSGIALLAWVGSGVGAAAAPFPESCDDAEALSGSAERLGPVAAAVGAVRTFGGNGQSNDIFRTVAATTDGGYFLGGELGLDQWLYKVDADWKEQWSKVYGFGSVWAVEQTRDGGFVAVGEVNLGGLSDQLWIQKLKPNGRVKFQRTLGGALREYGYSVVETADGGFLIAGQTQSAGAGEYDAWLVRLSAKGIVRWQKTYGGVTDDAAYGARETVDGGFVVVGFSYLNAGFGDLWVFKVDADGDPVWEHTFGGSQPDDASDVLVTADGGFAVVGQSDSFGRGFTDVWILRLDPDGQPLWQETLGLPASESFADSVRSAADGGFLVSGRTDAFSNSSDADSAWVVKLKENGKPVWQATLGFPYRFDRGYEVEELADRSVLVVGGTYSLGLGGDGFAWVLSSRGKSCGPLFDKVKLAVVGTNTLPVATHATVGNSGFPVGKTKSRAHKEKVEMRVNCGDW